MWKTRVLSSDLGFLRFCLEKTLQSQMFVPSRKNVLLERIEKMLLMQIMLRYR